MYKLRIKKVGRERTKGELVSPARVRKLVTEPSSQVGK